ncbi:MAG: hypothetical protein HY929_08355 [Euryarchaeota archaeon]|nr:hypothetical protein [Euryarchaeota archaeon]
MGRRVRKRPKVKRTSLSERMIRRAKSLQFPNCKGLYPDCPEVIDVDNPPKECKLCPVLAEI